MQDIAVTTAVADAAASASGDAGLVSTLGHALRLAGAAAILVAVAGVALGAVLALRRFPGRRSLGAVTAALIAVPPGVAVFALAFAPRSGRGCGAGPVCGAPCGHPSPPRAGRLPHGT